MNLKRNLTLRCSFPFVCEIKKTASETRQWCRGVNNGYRTYRVRFCSICKWLSYIRAYSQLQVNEIHKHQQANLWGKFIFILHSTSLYFFRLLAFLSNEINNFVDQSLFELYMGILLCDWSRFALNVILYFSYDDGKVNSKNVV